MDFLCRILYCSITHITRLEINCGPLSEKISLGTPNIVNILVKRKSTTILSVAKETTLASTHFVTKSVQTKICFLFDDEGFIGPTKSMAHF